LNRDRAGSLGAGLDSRRNGPYDGPGMRSHTGFLRQSPILVAAGAALGIFLAMAALVTAQAPAGAPKGTVWDGVFSKDQATRGRSAYAEHCASCHGGDLQGGEGKRLVGDQFWTDWRETTVDYLLTRVSTGMPLSDDGRAAGTLSASTYEDLVAYILERNDFPAGTRHLTLASSAGVPIIRRDGPGQLPATTLARVVGCLAPRGANREWTLISATEPVRITDGSAKADTGGPLGRRQYGLKFVLKSLDRFVGHRMVVTGLLLGDGGVDGLNVSTIDSVSETCQ
jgi:S-disulfanyl-L-cysteine oxidoreductase SoxD